ncbi:MAG: DUF72 domain-containing protein [Candidatus Aquicultorales bacterium]
MARDFDPQIYIGTSGWSYEWWKDSFYPADLSKAKWLSYYSGRFSTVEINRSFYRLPTRDTFEKWKETVGEDFVFAVKASRYLTHNKKLKDPEEPWRRFIEAAVGLGSTLGPILFEFQPSWRKNAERLSAFLSILPDTFRYAFEFRHPTWFDSEVFDLLRSKGAALVTADSPRFPQSFEITAGFSFIRFHGGRLLYSSDYSGSELEEWGERILDMARDGRSVYAYFNNDAFGFAPKNARELIAIIEAKKEKAARRAA